VIQGLINAGMIKEEDKKDIVDTWVFDAKYSYPTPSVERDAILAEAIPFLEEHDIYSRGRFGMWKYEVSNTDHSLMQGVELINRLLRNEPETTIGMKYASTVDGRNAAVHERSQVAGSGDPKKAAEREAASASVAPASAAPGNKEPRREQAWQPFSARETKTPGETSLRRVASSRPHPEAKPGERPGKDLVAAGKAEGRDQPGDKTESHISEEELGITSRNDDTED
jgi:hypothetical protein